MELSYKYSNIDQESRTTLFNQLGRVLPRVGLERCLLLLQQWISFLDLENMVDNKPLSIFTKIEGGFLERHP